MEILYYGIFINGSGNQTFTFGDGTTDSTCSFGGTTWTAPSDARMKEEVETSTAGLGFINDLRPVTFKWKKEKDIPEELVAHSQKTFGLRASSCPSVVWSIN